MRGSYNGLTGGNTSLTSVPRQPRMKRQSRMVNFRVYTDTDSDILEWLDSMTEGEKSDVMRSALRAFITGQYITAPAPESSPFDEIKRQLADIQAQLAQGVVMSSAAPVVVEESGGLNREQLERREKKLARTDW